MSVQVVYVVEIKHPLKTTKGWHCWCHPGVEDGGVAVLVMKPPSVCIERRGAAKNAAFVDIVHKNRSTRVISVYCLCGTQGPTDEFQGYSSSHS